MSTKFEQTGQTKEDMEAYIESTKEQYAKIDGVTHTATSEGDVPLDSFIKSLEALGYEKK